MCPLYIEVWVHYVRALCLFSKQCPNHIQFEQKVIALTSAVVTTVQAYYTVKCKYQVQQSKLQKYLIQGYEHGIAFHHIQDSIFSCMFMRSYMSYIIWWSDYCALWLKWGLQATKTMRNYVRKLIEITNWLQSRIVISFAIPFKLHCDEGERGGGP